MNTPIILIVDDDANGRQLLKNLLEGENYQLVLAEHGHDALLLAQEYRPDVILLDVMMPDLDGFEVCRRLRMDEVLQHVPILLLTALDDRESKLQGLEAGADDFISKPFDSVELRTRLRTITRLNRVRQLYDERARFETAVAYSPDGIVLAAADGRIILSNTSFQSLVRAEAGDDPGLTIFDFFAVPEMRTLQNDVDNLGHVGRRLGPFETELQHARRDGTLVEVTVGRLPGSADVVLAFNIRDVTDKKQLETQLLRSQRIELLGELAGGIVHDVNNILAAISGNAILIEGSEPAKQAALVGNIETCVRRGAGILRKILMFARGSDHELAPTNTAALVNETSAIVSEVLGKHIEVSVDTTPGLPEIMADQNQLHQILMNFCVNARDAMPDGGKIRLATHRVVLGVDSARKIGLTARPGEFVTMSVADTGTGMPPHVRARLFDPFFTTKPADCGTGLGLATVLRLVKRHEGFIEVQTAVGEGTRFTCYFPVIKSPMSR